jgi:hypothetical protein
MPLTYTLISSSVLSSTTASVTFSSIPSSYTDLALHCSARSNVASVYSDFLLTINNDTTQSNYTFTYLNGQGTTASSGRGTDIKINDTLTGDNATASTFSNTEYYIPSYTASQFKSYSLTSAIENNDATAYSEEAAAILYRSNTAISTLKISPPSGVSFLSGSTFYLYGIKNS